jgi:hypothetical protein
LPCDTAKVDLKPLLFADGGEVVRFPSAKTTLLSLSKGLIVAKLFSGLSNTLSPLPLLV